MKTFELDGFTKPVTVTLTQNITKEQLLAFPGFKTWKETLQKNLALQDTNDKHEFHADPYHLRSVTVQSVDWFGPRIGFVKISAEIKNNGGSSLPGIALLRGGSVAMLMIIRPTESKDEKLVVMTEQPRTAAGSLSFLEIPAGMLDGDTFGGAAAKEIQQETEITVKEGDLIDLTELAVKESKYNISENNLQKGVYPSPGGSDEYIPIYLWEKEMSREDIENLRGKRTGERKIGEMIKVHLCNYDDLWKVGARDGKTLAAWALYEGLSKSGVVEAELAKRRKG